MRQGTLGVFGMVSVGFTVLAGFGFCPFSPESLVSGVGKGPNDVPGDRARDSPHNGY